MDYVGTQTLLASLIERQKFEEKYIRKVIKSLLQAVAYLHKQNILHLDIKLGNIILEDNKLPGKIKLIDFSLSQEIKGPH